MTDLGLAYLAAGLGAGVSVVGSALGIAKLAAAAMDGISRQPESSGDIRGAMIISAAIIEGAALLGLVICFLLAVKI